MPDLPTFALSVMKTIVYVGGALVYVTYVLFCLLVIARGLLALLRPRQLQNFLVEHVLWSWNPFRKFWRSEDGLVALWLSGPILVLVGATLLAFMIWSRSAPP